MRRGNKKGSAKGYPNPADPLRLAASRSTVGPLGRLSAGRESRPWKANPAWRAQPPEGLPLRRKASSAHPKTRRSARRLRRGAAASTVRLGDGGGRGGRCAIPRARIEPLPAIGPAGTIHSRRPGIRPRGRIAGVPFPIAVGVRLVRIGHRRAVVLQVGDAVPVVVRIAGVACPAASRSAWSGFARAGQLS